MSELKKWKLNEIEHYKVHGRTIPGVCPLPLFFNGSAVEVNVSGSELWIDLEVSYTVFEPWITCEINGDMMSRQMLLPGKQSICLFRGMSPEAVKNIKVTRELQAMSDDPDNFLLVHGFQSDGTFSPVPAKKLTLEFVGDSITSGEGTYGAIPDTDWLPMYMGYSRNYAKLVADALDADTYMISQGGWGVLSSWDANPVCNIPSRYEAVCGLCCGPMNEKLGAFAPYDFTKRNIDALIVNLCTNDASAFVQPKFTDPVTGESFEQRLNPDGTYNEDDLNRLKQAILAFLQMLRKHNPKAHIVWCYGMLGYNLSLAINDAINQYITATGDHNVIFLQLPNTTEETVGSHAHPGAKSHARAARVLLEYLQDYFRDTQGN